MSVVLVVNTILYIIMSKIKHTFYTTFFKNTGHYGLFLAIPAVGL